MITKHNSETIKFRDLTFETPLYFIHLKINFKISVKSYIRNSRKGLEINMFLLTISPMALKPEKIL
jgi:hypothetical protein